MSWEPGSWRRHPALQQVEYADPVALEAACARVQSLPPMVTSWEVEKLRTRLAEVARGEAFLLQGGDCAESFADCRSQIIDNKLKILLKMSLVLTFAGGLPVVRVARLAGQYAKPRSSDTETRDGVTLPSYRGDLVNGPEFTPEARRPDPERLVEGYARAAMTLNFVRSLLAGGFADLRHPRVWDLAFVEHSQRAAQYRAMVGQMTEAVRFLESVAGRPLDELSTTELYTSHEGLHLPFEEACTEQPPLRSRHYDLSSHFPWIGARTAAADGAHVEFFRGIANPVGLKVGPGLSPGQLVATAERLDPDREPGRLTLIHRLGFERVEELLPPLVEAVRSAGHPVVWCCDPMHGNTYTTADGLKTRRFGAILAEVERSAAVHAALGGRLGGVHLELTGEDVTEVVGGARGLSEAELARAYRSDVDPRLNAEQALELAFRMASLMRSSA